MFQKVCRQISLPITYVYYFALFLVSREEDGDINSKSLFHDFQKVLNTICVLFLLDLSISVVYLYFMLQHRDRTIWDRSWLPYDHIATHPNWRYEYHLGFYYSVFSRGVRVVN